MSDLSPGGGNVLSLLAFAVSLLALFRERLGSYLFGPSSSAVWLSVRRWCQRVVPLASNQSLLFAHE